MSRRRIALAVIPALVVVATLATAQRAAGRPAATAVWADSVLATLTLREKAAQMVWPTVLGDYVSFGSSQWRRVTHDIVEEKVGGYTISVGSPMEIATKLNAIQRMSRVPLLFGADLEFGAGFRARGGYFVPNAIDLGGAVLFPTQMAVGATGDAELAYLQGRITAIEGRALGIHVAYAPILDVNVNPLNPVINVRSYGENPHLASRLGVGFVRGLQEHGMIATGKHFPGHGDTEVNSHLALPVVTMTRQRLDSVEFLPFKAAIAAGLGAMMSFHGAIMALDSSGVPGTLSHPVLTGLLRNEMGFTGVAISDAMDMRGVLDRFGATEATKRAVAAGADVLIQPLDVRATIDAIVEGVREGRYTEARLDESVRRILMSKSQMGLDRNRYVSLDSVRAIVGDSAHLAAAWRIAERSIVLLKDSPSQVPLPGDSTARVLSITIARRADLAAGTAFNAELRRRYRNLRTVFVAAEDLEVSLPRLDAMSDSAASTIVSWYMGQSWDATTIGAPKPFVDFIARRSAASRKPILVSFGNPYLLQQTPSATTYVIAWSGFPVSQSAAARALMGESPIRGTMPVTIPGHAVPGAGLQRPAR